VLAALLAGTIAITANIVLLSIATAAGIRTAQGGLFRLFTGITRRLATSFCLPLGCRIWRPPVSQAAFHIATGWVMAIGYGLVLEPKLPGRPCFKGAAYGAAIWFLNAFLVLPLTNEGIAGSRHLTTVGMIVFAIAHMSFFLALSLLYRFILDWSARWAYEIRSDQ
jgi:hypothetical protein